MRTKIIWHTIGWFLFLLYWNRADLLGPQLEWDSIVIVISNNLITLLTFYFLYAWLCPRLQKWRNEWFFLLVVPVGIFCFIFTRYTVQEVLMPLTLGFRNYFDPSFSFYVSDNLFHSLSISTAVIVVFLLENKIRSRKEQALLQAEKEAAELAFLRSQLNPHFLFNTLSYLHTRAFIVDEQLADTILKLSDILRYAVQNSKVDKADLQAEVDLLHNYIEIFTKRFDNQCFIDFKVTGDALQQKIEPLLLMPFIENAFKHGVYTDAANPIKAQLDIKKGSLFFSCVNQIKRQQKDESSGIGLENVRRRLRMLYAGRHELSIQEKQDTFRVELRLEL